MRLLHIDSSISGAHSISRRLTASIVARLNETNPGLEVTYRDVAAEALPHQSPAILFARMQAMYDNGVLSGAAAELYDSAVNGGAIVEPLAQAALDTANMVLEEFLEADIVVIGAPMYNFSVPTQLKAWIDCLAVPGKTFQYSATGVEGLAGGKKVILASSRGGFYSAPSPMASLDHQETFLTSFLSFIGVTDITTVRAEGVNYGPEQRQKALESALEEAAQLQAA